MKKNIVIRKADCFDILKLVQMSMDFLYKEQGEGQVKKYIDLNLKIEAFFRKYLNNNLDVFLAELDGRIIAALGTSYLTLFPRMNSRNNKCAYLLFAYIEPLYENKELKKTLCEESMENAKKQGAEVYEIGVAEKDLLRYKALGFKASGYSAIHLMLGGNSVCDKWADKVEKNITLRKAIPSDIPQLVDIRMQFLSEVSSVEPIEKSKDFNKRLNLFLEEHFDKDMDTFVAELNGEILSMCFMLYYDKMPEPGLVNGKIGIPINNYTKPQYRNKGLSKALFEVLIKHAEKRGVEMLEMEIPENAMPFYEEFGFKPMKTISVSTLLI
ncbi:GNAT family N-acetyltransferase [Lacrimispora sp. BS-2]|uniref:GNAT family N-acetyltransferase n=1 Tax=Lacrimispora sp. BS-2 TaxID=3151850 RepID=A0AAU7PP39_9FIRM